MHCDLIAIGVLTFLLVSERVRELPAAHQFTLRTYCCSNVTVNPCNNGVGIRCDRTPITSLCIPSPQTQPTKRLLYENIQLFSLKKVVRNK
jgi:hypothetical protein